jgi:predicted nucleic acid-binding protein
MTRIALDSNILVYAELEPESARGQRAAEVITRVARDGVIPVQVLGEFLRVVQRRVPSALAEAMRQAALYRAVFLTPATTDGVMTAAAGLALAHRIQLWDGVVCIAAGQAGAKALFTDDLQDGRILDGIRLVNPFAPSNDAAVEALLTA